ncbi:MAG: cupin domain-containing protein [Deltaproteobacteria bacterium]|jgi:quercetin dioxygenase-like cupin family protein|nr:cupin domain-containing protein [Deltaproteobacteria bacterium]
MKITHYSDIEPTSFDGDAVKGVRGRVAIGKRDGADNFCMRIFEVEPDGYTPRHAHAWEHEILFFSGNGEVLSESGWIPVSSGTTAFIPGNEEHQIRNSGNETLRFACLIPSGPPEL